MAWGRASRERAWWERWTPRVQAIVAPAVPALVREVLSLEAIGQELDAKLCGAVLDDAFSTCHDQWYDAPHRLEAGAPLREVVPTIFPAHVPLVVAVVVLPRLQPSESPEVVIPLLREIDARASEYREIGLPRYLWVAVLKADRLADVRVVLRKRLRVADSRLIVVVDAPV